jgi:rhodanese-related sulfurtransferase
MEIDAKSLQLKLSGPNPPLLLDVRQPNEVQAEGRIDGSVLIPMNELPGRLAEIPQDREVVAFCKRGQRSYNVAAWLRQTGRNAVSLQGGLDMWKALQLPVSR